MRTRTRAHRFGDGRDRCASVSTQSTRSIGPSADQRRARRTSFSTRPPAHKRKPTHAYPPAHGFPKRERVANATPRGCTALLGASGNGSVRTGRKRERVAKQGLHRGGSAHPTACARLLLAPERPHVRRGATLVRAISKHPTQPATHKAWTRVGGGGVHSLTSSGPSVRVPPVSTQSTPCEHSE